MSDPGGDLRGEAAGGPNGEPRDQLPPRRKLDASSLQGLAHPLRVQLRDQLGLHGPATATQLGARLGESSGATSYHLRQLEKYGFVEEDPTRGSGRERWWRRVRGGISIAGSERRDAGRDQLNELHDELHGLLDRWIARMNDRPDDDLVDVALQTYAFPVGIPTPERPQGEPPNATSRDESARP